MDAEWIPGEGLKMTEVSKVGKPHKRRFLRRATPAQRGIGPGCWHTEECGLAGWFCAAWRACQARCMSLGPCMSLLGPKHQNILGLVTCIWTWHAPYVALAPADSASMMILVLSGTLQLIIPDSCRPGLTVFALRMTSRSYFLGDITVLVLAILLGETFPDYKKMPMHWPA